MSDTKDNSNQAFLVGTYNILNPFHAVKWVTKEGLTSSGGDNWDEWRSRAVCNNIEQNHLDICALQELSERTKTEIEVKTASGIMMQMSELYLHFTEDEGGAHGVAVLYNPERFKLLNDLGLKTSQESYRYAAMVDLEDQHTGSIYRVISVHLKGYNPYQKDVVIKAEEQRRGDEELQEYLTLAMTHSENLDGIFVLGDYNEDAKEMERRGVESRQGRLMLEGFKWTGVPEITETRSERQIDWIFYRDQHEDLYKIKSVRATQHLGASDHALTVVKHECSLDALTRFMI